MKKSEQELLDIISNKSDDQESENSEEKAEIPEEVAKAENAEKSSKAPEKEANIGHENELSKPEEKSKILAKVAFINRVNSMRVWGSINGQKLVKVGLKLVKN